MCCRDLLWFGLHGKIHVPHSSCIPNDGFYICTVVQTEDGFTHSKGSETTPKARALLDLGTHCINMNEPTYLVVHVDASVSEAGCPFYLIIVDVYR